MMFTRLISGALPVFAIVAVGASSPASAAITYSTSFESPAFAAGNIVGQSGWGAGSINSGAMNIANNSATAYSGSQFVRYDTADVTLDGSYVKMMYAPYSLSAGDVATSPNFEASVYVKIDDNPSTSALSWGGLDLIGSSGRVASLYFATNGIAATTTGTTSNGSIPALTLSLGTYHKLGIKINFATDAVDYYVNDALVRQTSTAATSLSMPAIYAARTGAGTTGHVFSYDNLTLTAVPEPTTAGVLALAGLAMAARRRRCR